MSDFRLSNVTSEKSISDALSVLSNPAICDPTSQDYPRHGEWLIKTRAHLESGKKKVMLAYIGNKPVAVVVYQRHPQIHETVELRNISVLPEAQGRLLGTLMLRQTEKAVIEKDYPDIDTIEVDTKENNLGMITFLLKQGYAIKGTADIYDTGVNEDVVLQKRVQ